ncbi:MAG: LamG-like jellyroll fold domain-containing protein [Myxococcota bacterium]
MKLNRSPNGSSIKCQPHRIAQTLLSLIAVIAMAGCGDYGGSSTDTSVLANNIGGGLPQGLSVSEQVTSFEATVYPLLAENCEECHGGSGPGAPQIAHPSATTAWAAVVDNQKVNFSSPISSRLVRRLGSDLHFCWSNCTENADEMLTQILAWEAAIEASGGTTGGVDVAELVSNTRTVLDGTEEVGDDRFDDGVIARWDFKEVTGTTAFDTSGVEPLMDLELDGPDLMSSYGIDVTEGRAQASADASLKLYDRIAAQGRGTQAYSMELWVANLNTVQEGPARIVSYGRNGGNHNFMLGQSQYQYSIRNRAFVEESNNNGNPQMDTYDVDQDAQSTLQHVVITYDQLNGRRIFVNGRWTEDEDPIDAGRLWNWDPAARLAFGASASGNSDNTQNQWLGQVRFAAIYDQPLSSEAILQNFEAGIGKRLTLAFDVSQWTGGTSTIEFDLTELDGYSYLLCSPRFTTDTGAVIRIQNMRIQLNGIIPVSGQGFTNLNALVTNPTQQLSGQCSIIGGLVDPNTDEFQLVFEQLGIFQDPVATVDPPEPGVEVFGEAMPTLGIRDFARVNATMAAVTGVDPQVNAVDATYEELTQQLPAEPDMRSFVSANQVGVAKLGIEYCDALVGDDSPASQTLRDGFFVDAAASFSWDSPPADAFDTPAEIDLITDPLLDQMVGVGLTGMVGGFPARDQMEVLLDGLVVDLESGCGNLDVGDVDEPACDGEYTKNMVKGLCTAIVSSGAVQIH